MRDLGYVEGRGFTVVERFADGRNERLPALAVELVKLRVDLILASSTNAVRAAQAATSTIPIVFESVADPVVAGFANSVNRPGRSTGGSLRSIQEEGQPQSITRSAWSSSAAGIVKRRSAAVLRLITISTRVGCSMGRSPGFAPLKILSTKIAVMRIAGAGSTP